jgi:predicted permease
MTTNDYFTVLFMAWVIVFATFGNRWLMRLEASKPSFLRWLFVEGARKP